MNFISFWDFLKPVKISPYLTLFSAPSEKAILVPADRSQLPITPVQDDSLPLFTSVGNYTHLHINMLTHRYI